MLLLIDAGNTFIKFATHTDNTITKLASCASHLGKSELSRHLQNLPVTNPQCISLTSTLDTQRRHEIIHLLQHLWPSAALHFIHTHPEVSALQHCYTQVHKLGTDRWLAMLAVISHHKTPAIIVDMGTVVTIDAIDGKQHLGGWMIPGLEKMHTSLSSASGIADVMKEDLSIRKKTLRANTTFGTDTESGALNGVQAALLGSIEQAIVLGAAQFHRPFTVYLTGGNAENFVNMLSMPATHLPNLIYDGLVFVTQHHLPLFAPQTVPHSQQDLA